MMFTETKLEGVLIYTPKVIQDERGYFFESYSFDTFFKNGIDCNFVQDNQSKSAYGVLRGLHYQLEPYSQAKLVRVIKGKILDVVVDIRDGSPTYKEWISVELDSQNFKQILIPQGFAHGFLSLDYGTIVSYKVDKFYRAESERHIRFDDPDIGIDWKIPYKDIIVSDKVKTEIVLA
jgi:dTDP-4-dehydrorhamnose 3,5-epimerase